MASSPASAFAGPRPVPSQQPSWNQDGIRHRDQVQSKASQDPRQGLRSLCTQNTDLRGNEQPNITLLFALHAVFCFVEGGEAICFPVYGLFISIAFSEGLPLILYLLWFLGSMCFTPLPTSFNLMRFVFSFGTRA